MLVVGVTADALAAADTVMPAAADVVAAAAASESLSICAGDVAAEAGELAAIAAAATASGAVALPDAAVAGGISVETMVTAIATATGFGVVTDDVASCCDKSAATVEESGADEKSDAEAVSAFRSVDFFSIGFAVPAFKVLGLAPDC